jgi:hypothetical protein
MWLIINLRSTANTKTRQGGGWVAGVLAVVLGGRCTGCYVGWQVYWLLCWVAGVLAVNVGNA